MRDDPIGIGMAIARSRPVSIKGQMLRLGEHREVAIYLRAGVVGIADFIDGRGQLVDVTCWFRFHCGSPTNAYVLRRMAIESAQPLSSDLTARIEALHRQLATQPSSTPLGTLKRPAVMLPRRNASLLTALRLHREVAQELRREPSHGVLSDATTCYPVAPSPGHVHFHDKENTCIPGNASD